MPRIGFTSISVFEGEFEFLSDKYETSVYLGGYDFSCIKAALLVASRYPVVDCMLYNKPADLPELDMVSCMPLDELEATLEPKPEKKEWSQEKLWTVEGVYRDAYRRNPSLREKLMETGSRDIYLVSHDTQLGIQDEVGDNFVGNTLVKIRRSHEKSYEIPLWLKFCQNLETNKTLLPEVIIIIRRDGKVIEDYTMTDSFAVLGKHDECEIIAEHPSLSRMHAAFFIDKSGILRIVDLASKSGTFVNGTRLDAHDPMSLSDDHEIRFGFSTRTYSVEVDPSRRIAGLETRAAQLKKHAAHLEAALKPRKGQEEVGSKTVVISNLPFNSTREDIVDFLKTAGKPDIVQIPQSRASEAQGGGDTATKGMAIVTFDSASEANKALRLSGKFYGGREIEVSDREREPKRDFRNDDRPRDDAKRRRP